MYKLSKDELLLLKISKTENEEAMELSGKPTTNIRSFFKRLFSKKLTIISLFVFFGLIVTAIIISVVSQYTADSVLTISGTNKNIDPSVTGLIPPTSRAGGNVDKIVSLSQYISLTNVHAGLTKINIVSSVVVAPDHIHVVFNPYSYLKAATGSTQNFILGTNDAGQDNWTRVWLGTLSSLELAFLVATVETIIGVAIGAYIGFHAGSRLDNYLMRIIDTIAGVPSLLWFILISFMLPPGFWTLFIALSAVGWVGPVYQTRMYTMRVKDLDFIKAARTVGVPKWKLIYKYGLPQSLGRILSQYVKRIPVVIFAQASLAFLGFSNSADANLGAVINDAKSHLDNVWYLLTPAFILFTITLSLQFVANGVNDALDPKVGVR